MSTRGQFNTKNPTIKRILKEASELSTSPSSDYHAEPLETNLFEWHFTIRGPPAPSAYANGIYHGRIVLPAQYPLRPPSFRFLTPTGRFEVNREICLSISDHHEETWQPAWGVRTALVAIRSFMDTDAKGQLGGIECDRDAREKMARESNAWKCPACGKDNAHIMNEREELVNEIEKREGKREDERVPEELRLAYRDELNPGRSNNPVIDKNKHVAVESMPDSTCNSSSSDAKMSTLPGGSYPRGIPSSSAPVMRPATHFAPDRSLAWIDTCIYGVVAALLFMIIKKFS